MTNPGGPFGKLWGEWDAWVESNPRVSILVVMGILWVWNRHRAAKAESEGARDVRSMGGA